MSYPWTRRRFLRGLGTCLVLPHLEALAPVRSLWAREREQVRRLLYVYLPNGVHVPTWLPSPSSDKKIKPGGRHGALPSTLPQSLVPLEPWRKHFSILTGLTCNTARANGDGPGDHARAAAAFLTGVQPLKAEGAVDLGPSADQIAAQAIGNLTRLRSLQLGCEASGNAGQCDSGYACAYSENISWQDATTPSSKETHPRRLFDQLFRSGDEDPANRATRYRRQRSVLDLVREDVRSLDKRLGRRDRDKLDEYYQGVRELERRLDFMVEEGGLSVPDEARPAGTPPIFRNHVRLLIDMLVLAFRTDSTRIATLMFGNEGSNRRFLEIGILGGHHSITHHKGDQKLVKEVQSINLLHATEFAYLLERFQQTDVDGTSLLDSTAILCGSGISDGNRHDHHNLPLLLAGGKDLGLRQGRLREYPVETPLGNLHMELLDKLKVKAAPIGDATGRLPNLDS